MKRKNVILLAVFSVATFFVVSCSKDHDAKPDPVNKDTIYPMQVSDSALSTTLQLFVVKNMPADPYTRDVNNGAVIGNPTHKYTLVNLSDGSIIPNKDSAEGKWDVGFNSTNIILNSGASGPGKVSGQVVMNTLDDVTEAPEDGYVEGKDAGDLFSAFTTGWFNYDSQTHIISPKPGFILVIHTHDGKYAKLEILNFYNGLPAHPTVKDKFPYYSFRYVIQQDGSRELAAE